MLTTTLPYSRAIHTPRQSKRTRHQVYPWSWPLRSGCQITIRYHMFNTLLISQITYMILPSKFHSILHFLFFQFKVLVKRNNKKASISFNYVFVTEYVKIRSRSILKLFNYILTPVYVFSNFLDIWDWLIVVLTFYSCFVSNTILIIVNRILLLNCLWILCCL